MKSYLAAILFGASLILCAVAVTMMSPILDDYYVWFYPAANDWVSGRYILYDGSYSFFCAPWMLAIIVPFAALPYDVSQIMWIAFTLLCIVVSVRCYGNFRFHLVALAIINQPLLNLLGNGQVDAIPLLGLSLSYLAVRRRNVALLSVGLLLIATKPQNLILASILLLLERWSWRALSLPVAAYITSGLFIGMDWILKYAQMMPNNLYRLGPKTVIWEAPIPMPIIAIIAVASLTCFAMIAKHDGLTKRTFSLALSTNMAYSIFAASAHFVMLIPAFLFLSRNWKIAILLYVTTWSLVLLPIGTWVGALYPLCIQVIALANRGTVELAPIETNMHQGRTLAP